MRALIQRVASASCTVDGQVVSEIGPGLLVFVAIHESDTSREAQWLADKVVALRIFSDDGDKMNLSCADIRGQILVVSQFTLYGDCRRGRRPSYCHSASPAQAAPLYKEFVAALQQTGLVVREGVFQAHMEIRLLNDGPVTLLVDSPAANGVNNG